MNGSFQSTSAFSKRGFEGFAAHQRGQCNSNELRISSLKIRWHLLAIGILSLLKRPTVAQLSATKLLAAPLVCHTWGKNSPLRDQMRIHMYMRKLVLAAGQRDLLGFEDALDC